MDGKLTALKMTALLKARKPGLFNDGGGLYLQIGRSGGRSWIFRYSDGSRTRDMGLGSVDTISLAEARDLARKQRRLRYDGVDPIEHRKATRLKTQAEAAKLITFKECAEAVRDLRKSGWRTEETAKNFITRLETHAYPIFERGNLPARDINTPLVVKVLSPIWLTKPIMAKEIRRMLEAVLSWATSVGCREGDNPARWKGHLENLLPAQPQSIRHHPALPYAELPAFMAHLRRFEGVVPRAFEFMILTGAPRTKSSTGARWDEIDRDSRVWTIPGSRMKTGKIHRVPLSDAALAILDEMERHRLLEFNRFEPNADTRRGRIIAAIQAATPNTTTNKIAKRLGVSFYMVDRAMKELRRNARENPPQMMSSFVFPGLGRWRLSGAVRKDQPIHPASLRISCLREQMNRRDITAHGFRSTFKDWCHEETNFPSEVIQMALGHAIDNKVEAAYRRGDLFKKRRELMEAWANFCAGSTADVISLPLRERRSHT